MYTQDQINVLAIVQATVKQNGVKALADLLSIAPQTLYADVDPKSIGRRTNKLGFLDWLVILSKSGDLSSLDTANRLFNRICLPIPEPSQGFTNMTWMEYCATIARESGEAVTRLADAILDGKMGPDEMEACEKETWDALAAFAELYLAIKKCGTK